MIDVVRGVAALGPFPWTDPILTAGVMPIKLVHLLELREALAAGYIARERPALNRSDDGGCRTSVHDGELRVRVRTAIG